MQGFLFSRPLPASEIEPFLRECAGETTPSRARRARPGTRWTLPEGV